MVLSKAVKSLCGTERIEQRGIDTVNISKSDRSVCWIDKVGAYLKARPWSEEYGSARRVVVEEIRRQQFRCGASVWDPVPVDLAAAMGKCAAYSVVGSEIAKIPEGVYRGLYIRWCGAGGFEHVGIGWATARWKMSVNPRGGRCLREVRMRD